MLNILKYLNIFFPDTSNAVTEAQKRLMQVTVTGSSAFETYPTATTDEPARINAIVKNSLPLPEVIMLFISKLQ